MQRTVHHARHAINELENLLYRSLARGHGPVQRDITNILRSLSQLSVWPELDTSARVLLNQATYWGAVDVPSAWTLRSMFPTFPRSRTLQRLFPEPMRGAGSLRVGKQHSPARHWIPDNAVRNADTDFEVCRSTPPAWPFGEAPEPVASESAFGTNRTGQPSGLHNPRSTSEDPIFYSPDDESTAGA